jgi:FKBP-type peptidyl-prolyl cis-trans isomerase FkpA
MKTVIALLFIAFAFVGCKTYSDDDKKGFDEKIQAYLKKKDIECTKSASGMYYKILEEGTGTTIRYKDRVSFTYKGEFLSGEVFDEQTEPLEYQVEELIGAWKEIMLEMKEGGKAFLVAPPQLGYGDHQLDDIPPNSILVYEIEVVKVQ